MTPTAHVILFVLVRLALLWLVWSTARWLGWRLTAWATARRCRSRTIHRGRVNLLARYVERALSLSLVGTPRR